MSNQDRVPVSPESGIGSAGVSPDIPGDGRGTATRQKSTSSVDTGVPTDHEKTPLKEPAKKKSQPECVIIVCADKSPENGKNFRLPMLKRAAELSLTLKLLIDFIGPQPKEEIYEEIVIENEKVRGLKLPVSYSVCTRATMEHIKNWCEYHYDDPYLTQPILETFDEDEYTRYMIRLETLNCFWDTRFFETLAGYQNRMERMGNLAQLFDVLIAAHFLQIDPLIEAAGKFICAYISGKEPNMVREQLNIVNDFTREEEEAIISDTIWAHHPT